MIANRTPSTTDNVALCQESHNGVERNQAI